METTLRRYYVSTGSSVTIIRDVDSFWFDECSAVLGNESTRLVFIERNLGDRVEAWISVLETKDGKEIEKARWNASKLQEIRFK